MKFLMVCLVGLLVSVSASPVSPPMVSGQVRLADGSPVAGAQVVLFDVADLRRGPVGQATTDAAGQFALPLVAGARAAYGVVVAGEGLVPYVNSAFDVEAERGPVDLMVETQPQARRKVVVERAGEGMPTVWSKVVPRLEGGVLGDVNNSGQVDIDDGLLAAMYSVNPTLAMPNRGSFALGDVNCNGRVDLTDAALITTSVLHSSDAAVEALRIGRRGGFSLDPVTERVWGTILGTELADPTVVRAIDDVPVLISGVMDIDGRAYLYLGIDRAVYDKINTAHLFKTLTERFPTIPFFIEPSDGIEYLDGRPEPEAPVHIFSSTFDSLDGWAKGLSFGDGWQIRSFDEHLVPGEKKGNTVAVASSEDCPWSCSVSTAEPLDLSQYTSVTLSLHRWVDDALGANAFLAVEIGKGDSYTRLDTWTAEDGDGVWHYETYPLDAKDLSDPVTLRFVASMGTQLLGNAVAQTLALDNVTLTGIPAPATQQPNLTIPTLTAPATVKSGAPLTLQATVRNTGGAAVAAGLVRVYQHPAPTGHPKVGTQVGTATLGTLAGGSSTLVSVPVAAPTVSAPTAYYYHACADFVADEQSTEDNCSTSPVTVTVRQETEEPDTPDTPDVPDTPEQTDTFALSETNASRTTMDAQSSFSLTVTVTNTGTTATSPATVHFYRHEDATTNPTIGGRRIVQTATTGAIGPNESKTVSVTTVARSVTTPTIVRYYACIEDTCSETPATIQIQPTGPDPTITKITALPANQVSDAPVTLQVTVRNDSMTTTRYAIIHIYQHEERTANPTGSDAVESITIESIGPNESVTKSVTVTGPKVTVETPFYFYACVSDTCVSDSAEVRLIEGEPDLASPFATMGGDTIDIPERKFTDSNTDTGPVFIAGGTIAAVTLGGLETINGERGFVSSAHAAQSAAQRLSDPQLPFLRNTDIFFMRSPSTYDQRRGYRYERFLGKAFKLPRVYREGGSSVLTADAVFVIYPHPQTPGCSLVWKGNGETLCLDAGTRDEYITRVNSLVIRGYDNAIYKVVGSQQPTKDLAVQFSKAQSLDGFTREIVENEKGVISNEERKALVHYENFGFSGYSYFHFVRGIRPIGGNSGSPIYTVPDEFGNTRIVGIVVGNLWLGDHYEAVMHSWDDVTEGLDLKPIEEL